MRAGPPLRALVEPCMAQAMDGSLLELDRAVARAAASLARWEHNTRIAAPGTLPLEAFRSTCGRTAYDRVYALSASEPLREALLRWTLLLTSERVNGAARSRCLELRHQPLQLNEFKFQLSRRDLLRGAISRGAQGGAWLQSFLNQAPPVFEAEALLAQRRHETARLLRLRQAEELSSPLRPGLQAGPETHSRATVPPPCGRADSQRTSGSRPAEGRAQTQTEPREWVAELQSIAAKAARALAPHTRRLSGGKRADWLSAALGTAGTSYPLTLPKRMGPRVLLGYFRETQLFRGLELPDVQLAANWGPASLLRNLEKTGQCWHDALRPGDQPFCVAEDPYGLERHRNGALFASLTVCGPFLQRELGVTRLRVAEAQRLVASVWVFELVARCLKVMLSEVAQNDRAAYAAAFEELSAEYLGVPLPPEGAGALLPLKPDDGQALLGVALAFDHRRDLTEAHDEDWYRNPRATEQLRAERRRPPATLCAAASANRALAAAVAELEHLLD